MCSDSRTRQTFRQKTEKPPDPAILARLVNIRYPVEYWHFIIFIIIIIIIVIQKTVTLLLVICLPSNTLSFVSF